MDYFNIDGTNLESTSYTAGDFDAYPFLGQTSTTEETNEIFADGWDAGVQPDHGVGFPRRLGVEASFDTVTSTTPYDTQTHSDGALPFPGYYCEAVQPDNEVGWSRSFEAEASFDTATSATPYSTQAHNDETLSLSEYSWPVTGRYPQSYGPCIASWENSFTSIAASKASTTISVPSNAPLDYWWNSESGTPISTFYDMNVQAPHQHGTSTTRNMIVPMWQPQPYRTPSAPLNEHTNAEAGPSTLMPPFVPYMAQPATHPSGGPSETTADAGNKTITEEYVTPTTKRARGKGQPCNWRTRYQENIRRLRAWAKAWGGLEELPTHKEALRTALGVIESTRTPVYPGPRLQKGIKPRSAQGKKSPDTEHKRRKRTRDLHEELSRYYQLGVKKSVWECPGLLSKVLEELEELLELYTVPSA